MSLNYDLITITLNSEKTLQRTLDSVSCQKQLPSRYIFIDADSKDQTLNIIEKFKESHPDIKVVIEQQSGKGISQAWNQALALVESEIICLLNSDDWWLPNTMEKVIKEFIEDKSIQILSGGILYCKNENDNQPVKMFPRPIWQMPYRMCFMHPATFVKKDVYENIGQFNENFKCSMDYDFMYRALKKKIKLKTSNEIYTNMQAGGLANSTRKLARIETRDIAILNGRLFIPWISWLMRTFTGK